MPINSLTELVAACEENRVIPAVLGGSSVEAMLLEAESGEGGGGTPQFFLNPIVGKVRFGNLWLI